MTRQREPIIKARVRARDHDLVHTTTRAEEEPVANLVRRAEDVAAYLGVSKLYVYEVCKLGKIPAIRVGRLLRFDMDKVTEAIAK